MDKLAYTINDLVTKIREASIAYYTGNAIITDKQFDTLIDELRALDPENPTLKMVGWGYRPNRDAVKHRYLTGSLKKIYDTKDIPFLGSWIVSPKWDGLTAVLEYSDGKLVQALSRGNGFLGQIITQHCYSFVPQKINFKGELFVRGEIVIDRTLFKEIQEDCRVNGTKVPANERNYAAGRMNKIEANEIDKKFNFIAYSIMGSTKKKLEQLEFLNYEGFQVTGFRVECPDSNIVRKFSIDESFQKYYDSVKDFLIDGLVITNNKTLEEVAYKFEDENADGIVDYIEWNMSGTGRHVPVAILKEALKLEGTEVRRALAFHATFIKENNIGTDTIISLCKANKIIPHIEEIVFPTKADLPTECPRCRSTLKWVGLDLCCMDENCIAKEEARLWELANIIGLPKGLAETTLNEWFNIDFNSQFNLILETSIVNFEQGNITHYQTLLDQFIAKLNAKKQEGFAFSEFWQIMCIPGLGQEMANRLKEVDPRKLLIENTDDDIDTMYKLKESKINGNVSVAIGANKYWREAYKWFKFKETKPTENQEQFQVVVTGTLFHHKRADFEKLLKNKGIKLGTSVSKNTKYLITNTPNSGTNKNVAAQKLGVELITEEDFMKRYLD